MLHAVPKSDNQIYSGYIEFAELSNVVKKKKDINWLFKANQCGTMGNTMFFSIMLLDPQIILLLSLLLREGHFMPL